MDIGSVRQDLLPRQADPVKEAAVHKFYESAFNGLQDDVWRQNHWALDKTAIAKLQDDGKDDQPLVKTMLNNYDLLRGLSAERPVTILEDFYPTHLGENSPRMWDGRRRIYQEGQTRGINLDDIRLVNQLGIEKNREDYIRERVIPDADHAANAYTFWGATTGFLAGVVGCAVLMPKQPTLALNLLGVGATAALATGGGLLSRHFGREMIYDDYAQLQKRVDQFSKQLK